jgi:hypothetical protein
VLFWLLYSRIPAVRALERLDQTRATSHAIALGFGGKDAAVKKLTRRELEEAFPKD